MVSKRWQIAPQAPLEYVEQLRHHDIHPVLAHILYQRGYQSLQEVETFLGHYDQDDNPFRLKGMLEAVFRLRLAIRNGEQIAVYGDFDVDGVTSTVLLCEVLSELGAKVQPYIPNRIDEGYGLHLEALKSLAEAGVSVVITVDCGIRSVQEVEAARELGLDVIITDHHSVAPVLPPAVAVINPKQSDCRYPEKMLAGVGIAYKLAQALYMEAQRRGYRPQRDWHPDEWLDLVAIGTVADVAPLRGENRELVRRGLRRLNQTDRVGLQALYSVIDIKPGSVLPTTIGFAIGPRINAAGRLRSAMLAYHLLTAVDYRKAMQIAQDLESINHDRREMTFNMTAWAEQQLADQVDEMPLLFIADSGFEQGIVGLIASRLTDRYYRPTVVIELGEEESHGSCRSIPEFHITHALQDCDDLLEQYGGHSVAAGFTIRNENIPALKQRLMDLAANGLAEQQPEATLVIDTQLELCDATPHLVSALGDLEPTGAGNPVPLFVSRNVKIESKETVGAEDRHLKLHLSDGNGTAVQAIAFRRGAEYHHLPDALDIVYQLTFDEWRGRRRLQLNIKDMRPAGSQ
ncbi:MAG: single-stranded-DNA-specific exonuclease RecJ [Chloroflexi bacterium]|nr:single-stranded-DNA-specific exonuclease RecJ [Chloroflexota bacterium]